MQVSSAPSQSSSITLGGHKAVAMTVSESADFFHILSSSLYSDPILAVIREVLCNAWDSHIASNNTKDMVDVTLTGDTLTIKDYGLGIPAEAFTTIYGTCGLSTKKGESGETGGFGLGCKSPFAYTDTFTVENCNNGVKYIYVLDKSSVENDGKPSISLLTSFPCNETGLKVIIPIRKNDWSKFNTTLNMIIEESGIPTKLNGDIQKVLPYPDNFEWGTVNKFHGSSRVFIKYGSVLYPVDLNKFKVSSALNLYTKRVIINAPANSIDLVPSREALNYSAKTLKTVKKLLNKVGHDTKSNISRVARSLATKDLKEFTTNIYSKSLLTDIDEILVSSCGHTLITDSVRRLSAYLPVPFKTKKAAYLAQKPKVNHLGPMIDEVSKAIYKVSTKLGVKIKLSITPKSIRSGASKRENLRDVIVYSLSRLGLLGLTELFSSPIYVGKTLAEVKARTPGGMIFIAAKVSEQETLVNSLIKAGFKVDWSKPEAVKAGVSQAESTPRVKKDYIEAARLSDIPQRKYYDYINTSNIPFSELSKYKYVLNISGRNAASSLSKMGISADLLTVLGDINKVLLVNTAKDKDVCIRKGLKCFSTYYIDTIPTLLSKYPNLLKELKIFSEDRRLQCTSAAIFKYVFKFSDITPYETLLAMYSHHFTVMSTANKLGYVNSELSPAELQTLKDVRDSSLVHIYCLPTKWSSEFVEDLDKSPEAMNCFNYLLNTKG